ncbi:alpha/beta hydrolase-fold protein [Thalassotalea euphylliae]|uniref:alpha/beta hydrolase-fold protein n=1 Tax=Thalassotalea euphylliae TaxID=1655234 RepID=UPI00362AF711
MLIKTTLFFIVVIGTFSCQIQAKVRGYTSTDGLYSKILDENRELLIHLPNSYHQAPKRKYPVMYLLDGLRNFNHAAGTLDLLNQSFITEEMIIIGIKNTHRTRDFTPTYDESYNKWGISGGADNFLDFLEKELIPYINYRYRANDIRILSGHSLGGLLAVYSLHTRPSLFQAHFAFSPSLWWHNRVVLKNALQFYANEKTVSNFLYINMGNEGGHMLETFQAYKTVLDEVSTKNVAYHADLIEHENHNTTAMVGHNSAYRALTSYFSCPDDELLKGIEKISECYQIKSKRYGITITPSYRTIRDAANLAFKNKEMDRAVSIYKTLISTYPDHADAHFRFAYVLEEIGELDKALDEVKKALAISVEENVENNAYKTYRDYLISRIKD